MADPLAISVLGSTALVRQHKLTSVDVRAREAAVGSRPCDQDRRSLRRYDFTYQSDADTGQAQLRQVTMIGQEGTPERQVALPVASYSYGHVLDFNNDLGKGELKYAAEENINLPTNFNIANDALSGIAATQGVSSQSITLKGLYDANGDGRLDLVYGHGASFTTEGGRLWRNEPGLDGAARFTDAGFLNPNHAPFIYGTQVSRTDTTELSFGLPKLPSGLKYSRNNQTQQLIDMNGDGRLDIVRSDFAEDDTWDVYLNTPNPNAGNEEIIVWERRTISTVPIAQHLIEAGLLQPAQSHRIPLSRSFSSKAMHPHNCWRWTGSDWVGSNGVEGYPRPCLLPQGDNPGQSNYGTIEEDGETTFVEWRLQDINGDGYPDLVYNGGAITAQLQQFKPSPGTTPNQFRQSDALFTAQPASTIVKALINVAGVHLDSRTNAFSAPVVLEANGDGDGCSGVIEKWIPNSSVLGRSDQVCGFQDINGDGLADRIYSSLVNAASSVGFRLGTGDLNARFLNRKLPLPGPLTAEQRQIVRVEDNRGTQYKAPESVCPSGSTTATYPQQRIIGMRDLNGDGIPDYISGENQAPGVPNSTTLWRVRFGTGTGFSAPASIVTASFQLSLQSVSCKGLIPTEPDDFLKNTGVTTSGLFDLNGDGLPDLVQLSGSNRLVVGKLSANGLRNPTPPISGRLTSIGNGYGAFTNIVYRSAKEDASTSHLLPYPEVVVTAVNTQDASGNALTSPALYAYGGARQHFDAALDRWVFPGYQRRVTLQNAGDPNDPGAGKAIIADHYPLAPFDPNADATARFLRYSKAGRTSDVTTLSGNIAPDPWQLLTTDIRGDLNRIAASHFDYTARLLPPGSSGTEFCVDMVYPYDYGASLAYSNSTQDSRDQCTQRGFALETSATSYRGTPVTSPGTADEMTSRLTLKTGSTIDAFDDFGRITDSTSHRDLSDPSTDLCVHVDYATPTSDTGMRVLNAPAAQTVTDCHGVTLTKKRFEYDGLAPNPDVLVANGFVTSSTVTRYDLDTHASLGDIRLFDAAYNADGTLRSITRNRDDGATATTTINSYDPFGLIATEMRSTAVDADGDSLTPISVSSTPDPVTLNITSTTDANRTVRGTRYDGFGRVVRSTIRSDVGAGGVLSSIRYSGFELGSITGRSVVQKGFTDAVAEANVETAPGRVGTTFFDSLGRTLRTEAQLGADYQNKTVVVGKRTYDALGRVKFMADPLLTTDNFDTAYGTTYKYNADGRLNCFFRGPGVQMSSVDEANEIYPTCFQYIFDNNKEILERLDPDQQGAVVKETTLDALGRVLQSRAYKRRQFGSPEVNHERAAFGYNALGHLTSMTRYQDPTNQTGSLTTTWHYDSLGWMTKLEETGVATQTRSFDSWGNVTQVQWCDDLTVAPCPTADRRSITRYDARGRVIHKEDQVAGQTVPGTVNDFGYETGFLNSEYTRGRLSEASWPTGRVSFTYDAFGRVHTKSFIDMSVFPGKDYIEGHDFHDDGSEKTLHLLWLPDNNNNKTDEKVDYAYDTAGRVKSAIFSDGVNSQTLFAASGGNPIYDVFGRITNAQYGLAQFNATFAAAGRRLLTDVKVTSQDGSYRRIAFPTLDGLPAFDPVGRERGRTETRSDFGLIGSTKWSWSYDPIGQLASGGVDHRLGSTTSLINGTYAHTYDRLGNLLGITPSLSGTHQDLAQGGQVAISYRAPNYDRVCGIGYAGEVAPVSPEPCNVLYDGAGNVVSQHSRSTSGTRTLSYFPNGQVSSIVDGASNASFIYDAFGAVQQLTVNTPQADQRADKHFGAFIKQRIEGGQSVLTRQIPVPGAVATRHGPGGSWTFAFGEARGTRFVTDQAGKFVQNIGYEPFGRVNFGLTYFQPNTTAGSTNYTSEQWNGGDLLQAFGVVQLGARLYDPVIGRFLARDPLISAKNPYAFADNDPVNKSDPTGLTVTGLDNDAPPPQPDANCVGTNSCSVVCRECIGRGEVIEVRDVLGRERQWPGDRLGSWELMRPLGQRNAIEGALARLGSAGIAALQQLAADQQLLEWANKDPIYVDGGCWTCQENDEFDAWRQYYFPTLSDQFPNGLQVPKNFLEWFNQSAVVSAYADQGGGELLGDAIRALVDHFVGRGRVGRFSVGGGGSRPRGPRFFTRKQRIDRANHVPEAKNSKGQTICEYCRKPTPIDKLQGDHVNSWARGGTTTPDNQKNACGTCNGSKSAHRLGDDWIPLPFEEDLD